MIRYRPLFNTSEFRIGRFDHPQGQHHRDADLEITTEYSVSRVECGKFSVKIGRDQWDVGPGSLFLNYPGMEYRCRHRELVPSDVCAAITYVPGADSTELALAFGRAARTRPILPPSNRLAYLFLRIVHVPGEPMAVEETAHSIIGEAIAQSDPGSRLYGDHQMKWYADRVDAARRLLEQQYDRDPRLAWVSRSVGMSPFHFARIFRELVGIPPHSYLRRIRLHQAAHRLRGGASVTEACFSSGFQNLSHFTRQFRRHFGVRPSAFAHQTSRTLRALANDHPKEI